MALFPLTWKNAHFNFYVPQVQRNQGTIPIRKYISTQIETDLIALIHKMSVQFSSVQFRCSVLSDSLWPHGLHHSRLPCPSPSPRLPCLSPSPGACSNSCLLSWWCHPTISSSVDPFSFFLQSFPASGSFPRSQFFTSGGQSIGASASASIIPVNIQDWFPLELTGLISLLPKGLSRVFSNTTVQKHQFFRTQLSL